MTLPSDIDAAFIPALISGANQLGADPFGLAAILYSESGIHSNIKNSIGCVGINQFCPSTAAAMGITDMAAYQQLPASKQWAYVMKFWSSLIKAHNATPSARDIYWLNFLPATYVKGVDDTHVITSSASIVAANPGFSRGKSYITTGDLSDAIANAVKSNPTRWAAIAQAITDGGGVRGGGLIEMLSRPPSGFMAFLLFLGTAATYAAWKVMR